MLNTQQLQAVRYSEGPLLVVAGAGSGKTRVITQKIVHLIEHCNYVAQNICAVTFTNKAAQEMRQRIGDALPSERRRGLVVCTFHALGLQIIKRHLDLCKVRRGFSVFDSEDSLQILKDLVPAAKAQERSYLKQLQSAISHCKNQGILPAHSSQLSDQFDNLDAIFESYHATLVAYNAVDFDDLIALPVRLFNQYPDALAYWQHKIRYLLVDEYQDSNTCQYQLVQLLTAKHQNFTVVGDDDQSVYAWRGARPENLVQLSTDYSSLKVIKLEQNYRSQGRILQVANCLIGNNPHIYQKKLWSGLGLGDKLKIIVCKDEQDEAMRVAADIVNHRLRNGGYYGNYAILYRSNHQSRLFEKSLRQHGITYQMSGGQSWFSRIEIKDAFAYLKLLCNPDDNNAFIRAVTTPKRGIGDVTLKALSEYASSRNLGLFHCCDHLALSQFLAEKPRGLLSQFKNWMLGLQNRLQKNASETVAILNQMISESGLESHWIEQAATPKKAERQIQSVVELWAWVGRLLEKDLNANLADIVHKLILLDMLEQSEESSENCVQLMTLHAAKGLEFDFVYLVGMEEDILPHRESIDNDQIEEERRLAYVGITRAKRDLTFTLAKARRRGGALQSCEPSRFLEELPEEDLEWFGVGKPKDKQQSQQMARSHIEGLKKMLEI